MLIRPSQALGPLPADSRASRVSVSPCFCRREGFALLITVTLLAFLVLLLVSLASLTRVETMVAGNSQKLSLARQNALAALTIAVGELQKYAGPDQRTTARADIESSSTVNGAKRWTGVWGNASNPQSGVSSTPTFLQWLVSGNEATAFNPASQVSSTVSAFGQITSAASGWAFTPATSVTGLGPSSTVFSSIVIGTGTREAALLVGPHSVGNTPGALGDYVVAPLVDIKVPPASVPGSDPSGGNVTVGRYAYWVGDEGIKARINRVDPYVLPTSPMAAAGVTADLNSSFRLMAPQRLGIERVTGYADFPVNEEGIRKIIDDGQVLFVDPNLAAGARQGRFHDLTIVSSSVLADQLRGGLKRDLTFAFARNDLNEYRATIRDPMRTLSSSAPNPLLSAVLQVDAAHNTPAVPENTLIAEQGPSWEQLRSYARLGADIAQGADGVEKIAPRIQTGTQQGIYPILVQARLGFGGQVTAVDATNATFTNYFYPSFVLANPYNVTIAKSKYRVRVFFGAGYYGIYVGGEGTPRPGMSKSMQELFDGAIFELDCPDLAAGEARVFTLDSAPPVQDVPWAASKIYPMANDWDAAFARIVWPTGVNIERTVFEGDATGKRLGLHPIFSDSGSEAGLWGLLPPVTGEPYLPNGPHTVASPMGWALTNEADEVYQRFDNYMAPAGGATVTQTGYKGVLPIIPGPQSYLLFRLAETGNFNKTTGNYYTQVAVYPYYALGNIRAPMVSRPATYTANNIYSTLLFSQGFEKNSSLNPTTPTFANWIRLDPSGSDYKKVEWQGLRKADQMSSLDQARMQWAPADVPREPNGPLSGMVSLGQLQHFNAGGYNDGQVFPTSTSSLPLNPRPSDNAIWRPRHVGSPSPIGNSRAHPYVARERVRDVRSSEPFYDQSYLLNRQLFDGYFFSTYPQTGAVDLRTYRLANSSLAPFRPEVASNEPERFRGGATFGATDVFLPARNLMQKGGFNANSTSVDAWRAVLSAFGNTTFKGESSLNAPFVRSIHQLKGSSGADDGISDNAWNGFRNLTPTQIDAFAVAIVGQIKQRGVAVSLSDFINRKLVVDTAVNAADGLSGPLQAAIDTAGINTLITSIQNWDGVTTNIATLSTNAVFPYPAHLPKHALEGIAGWLTQADVVQALAPILTARSDTFRIRTYGETRNPATQAIEGRAWCEAIVQRMPDYVVSDNTANDASVVPSGVANNDNKRFGRRFVVVGFRWLSPQDI